MKPLKCIVTGNGSLLIECCEILIRRNHKIVAVITDSTSIRDWAKRNDLPLAEMNAHTLPEFDWLFSIANLKMIPENVLSKACQGAINFHDGPLPRHAGLNAPVWALLEGETQHGITWHLMESGVDRGDILEQVMFDIAPDETALTINTKCYEAALNSFAPLLGKLETAPLTRHAQDFGVRSLHRKSDRPDGAARLDFCQSADAIAALIRALDHGSYRNPLCCPKIEHKGRLTLVTRAETVPPATDAAPGTVLSADKDALVVATGSVPLRLSGLSDTDGNPVVANEIVAPGETLASPDKDQTAALNAAMKAAANTEDYWRQRLTDLKPVQLSLATRADIPAEYSQLPLEFPKGFDLTDLPALIALWAGNMTAPGPLDLAYKSDAKSSEAVDIYLSDWVPLRVSGGAETFESLTREISATLSHIRRKGPYARDLIRREPDILPFTTPDIGLSAAKGPIPGTCLTIDISDSTPCLHADMSRLSDEIINLLVARLKHLAEQFARPKAKTIPLIEVAKMPEAERDMLRIRWNATGAEFDAPPLIHLQFEAQVARAPDAPAICFEDQILSYRDLNARANRLAHVLRDMGVGPDVPVGLASRRSPDLLVAALAILKAGGAYVPLDPDFPAERLQHYIKDSGLNIILTQSDLVASLPENPAKTLCIDSDSRLSDAPDTNPDSIAASENLAYLIYTSGSTGTPKGVMVEHRNVANFFGAMDAKINRKANSAWLAVTSPSFDISVLELFYTLARGIKLVIGNAEMGGGAPDTTVTVSDQAMEFSLYFWGNDDGPGPQKYQLLLEGAKFADQNGFCAVWTPERHFHAFGGPFPNPAVTGAAVAAVTKNLSVRAGSCVAPLHHTARIAEDWAVIDNLTAGRAGLGIASGWQPDDFVLRPQNAPPENKPAMYRAIDELRRLWRGEAVEFPTSNGGTHAVVTQPRPVSKELPIWLTIAGNPATWREAGEIGANVLTHLLGQSIDEVKGKIKIYHEALRGAGFDPADFKVTMMLHTFVGQDREQVRETVRGPMKDYLTSAAGLIKQCAWSFPAFKKPKGVTNPFEIDLETLTKDELEGILEFAFQRYFEESGLFGTVEDCLARVEQLKRIGIHEVACLIDYGVPVQTVLEGLKPLAEVLRRSNTPSAVQAQDYSVAAQIRRYGVTHLQCTPGMARIILTDQDAKTALGGLDQILLGGEPLPGALVAEIQAATNAEILNMYGPTETTIWSSSAPAQADETTVNIGFPIANTQFYVLDDGHRPVPLGVPGELYIGGAGVTRGYWQAAALTAERFLHNPFAENPASRMYRTGDLVRQREDGALDFLGRTDQQIKLRGYRIELGEIEARLLSHPEISQAAVVLRGQDALALRLVAFFTSKGGTEDGALRAFLATSLPDYMIPAQFQQLDSLPLTPNRKLDRKALATMPLTQTRAEIPPEKPTGDSSAAQIAAIWAKVLGVGRVSPSDSFFDLGGHSLLAVQALREMQTALPGVKISITDIFRFPVLSTLAAHLDAQGAASAPDPTVSPATRAHSRSDAMAKRRAMRARRLGE